MKRLSVGVMALYWLLVIQVGGRTEYAQRGFHSLSECSNVGRMYAVRFVIRPGNPEVKWSCTPEPGDYR